METAIITDMGFDTPPHPKALETNLQDTTRDMFQTNTNQLMTLCLLKSCPPAGSGLVGKMVELCSARLFLGLFDGNAS